MTTMGYVIRWWRTMIPSNSLAAFYGIAADCAERRVLGPDISFDIEAIDEMNTRIGIPRLIARMREHGGFGLVALVGVQSNQYPRALDIARPFRAAGINPDNLMAAKKRQNKITEYRKMLLAWKAQGIITLAGYILGLPGGHSGDDRPRHRNHQARACGRHAGILALRRCQGRRTIRSYGRTALRWMPTSTDTISSTSALAILA